MSFLEDLITKYVKRQELLLNEPVGLSKNRTIKPFITISRESGSGGKPIARSVAKKLGFTIYDKRLIEMTAKKTKRGKIF